MTNLVIRTSVLKKKPLSETISTRFKHDKLVMADKTIGGIK